MLVIGVLSYRDLTCSVSYPDAKKNLSVDVHFLELTGMNHENKKNTNTIIICKETFIRVFS